MKTSLKTTYLDLKYGSSPDTMITSENEENSQRLKLSKIRNAKLTRVTKTLCENTGQKNCTSVQSERQAIRLLTWLAISLWWNDLPLGQGKETESSWRVAWAGRHKQWAWSLHFEKIIIARVQGAHKCSIGLSAISIVILLVLCVTFHIGSHHCRKRP